MHFATGMICAGGVGVAACFFLRRGWRWLPAAMTVGGLWALAPDLPRIFREDFPSFPFAPLLGDKDLERSLHAIGDLFFFHASLDAQPREFALHGLLLIIVMYNLGLMLLMRLEKRQRNSMANRAWRAHRSEETRALRKGRRRRRRSSSREHERYPAPDAHPRFPLPVNERPPFSDDLDVPMAATHQPAMPKPLPTSDDPIVGQIGFSDQITGSAS